MNKTTRAYDSAACESPRKQNQREYQINSALTDLSREIGALDSLANDLFARLEPVMHADSPEKGGSVKDAKSCPLATQIEDSVDVIERVNNLLRTMLDRIEIS